MTANGAWRQGRLTFGAAGNTGSPESFSALTTEVHPVGIIKTAFGTLHFHLHGTRRSLDDARTYDTHKALSNEHKKVLPNFYKYNKHVAALKKNG